MTNYTDLITKAFEKFGFKPRDKQIDIINKVLNAYIDEKYTHVALSASTGIGKSLIALITSEVLYSLYNSSHTDMQDDGEDDNYAGASYILAHTNTLLDQYVRSYEEKFDLLHVMGAMNYDCATMDGNASDCIRTKNSELPKIKFKCEGCEYFNVKSKVNNVKHLITNYSYFFISALNTKKLMKRLLTVYDEGHLLNDLFVNHMKISVEIKSLEKYIHECDEIELDEASSIFRKTIDGIIDEQINEENYTYILQELKNAYKLAHIEFKDRSFKELKDNNKKGSRRYKKISNKFLNIYTKIKDFYVYDYERVVEIKEKEFSVSTIFMKDMFKTVSMSKYHLFMSATVDDEFLETTLELSGDELKFINAGSIFDPDNKEVVYCDVDNFNYKKMQDPKFLNNVSNYVNNIVDDRSDEKGIVLVTSFKLARVISEGLDKFIKSNKLDIKVFEQTNGKSLNEVLTEYIEYDKPSIIISPSMFEGISLDDDLCRYIIFTKAPYPSLGDKRMSYISKMYENIYKKTTLYKIIQGSGRAVRNENDWCTVYFLDTHLKWVFQSKHNYWIDEFTQYKMS